MDFPNGFGYLRHLRKGTWCEPMTKTTDEEILALLAEMDESEIEKYLLTLNEDEQAEIAKLLADAPIWFPLEGTNGCVFISSRCYWLWRRSRWR